MANYRRQRARHRTMLKLCDAMLRSCRASRMVVLQTQRLHRICLESSCAFFLSLASARPWKLLTQNGTSDSPDGPVLLQVRGQKHTSRIMTRVIYEGQHIASFRRFQLDERSIKEDWFRVLEATVASNVDLTLVGFSRRQALFSFLLTRSRSP